MLGWFDGDSLALAYGPPADRVRLLLALMEAGVVELIGPEMVVEVDETAGRFRAASPVTGRVVTSAVLLETRMSKGKIPRTSDPLLRALSASAFGAGEVDRLDALHRSRNVNFRLCDYTPDTAPPER